MVQQYPAPGLSDNFAIKNDNRTVGLITLLNGQPLHFEGPCDKRMIRLSFIICDVFPAFCIPGPAIHPQQADTTQNQEVSSESY